MVLNQLEEPKEAIDELQDADAAGYGASYEIYRCREESVGREAGVASGERGRDNDPTTGGKECGKQRDRKYCSGRKREYSISSRSRS